jgi:hypothetical protein
MSFINVGPHHVVATTYGCNSSAGWRQFVCSVSRASLKIISHNHNHHHLQFFCYEQSKIFPIFRSSFECTVFSYFALSELIPSTCCVSNVRSMLEADALQNCKDLVGGSSYIHFFSSSVFVSRPIQVKSTGTLRCRRQLCSKERSQRPKS